MSSCKAAVKASLIYELDRVAISAVEELPFIVLVFVLHLHLCLHQLVALPQGYVLDAFNLPDTVRTQLRFHC